MKKVQFLWKDKLIRIYVDPKAKDLASAYVLGWK